MTKKTEGSGMDAEYQRFLEQRGGEKVRELEVDSKPVLGYVPPSDEVEASERFSMLELDKITPEETEARRQAAIKAEFEAWKKAREAEEGRKEEAVPAPVPTSTPAQPQPERATVAPARRATARPETGRRDQVSIPSPREITTPPELETLRAYGEMREFFGRQFFGVEAYIAAGTLINGHQLFRYTPQEIGQLARAVEAKRNESDVSAFLARIERGENGDEERRDIDPTDWFVECAPTHMYVPRSVLDNIERGANPDEAGTLIEEALSGRTRASGQEIVRLPITMQNLQRYIGSDMQARGQGKLLYNNEGTGWYNGQNGNWEQFYTTQQPNNGILDLRLVTRSVVSSTLTKNHERQTRFLQQYAQAQGLNFAQCRRSLPVEIVLRFSTHLRLNGDRIHINPYQCDRTDEVSAGNGNPVDVGYCDEPGADVRGDGYANGSVGSSLVR